MKSFLSIFIGTFILLNVSCSSKVAMKKSSVVPAAEATVKVKESDNGNYTISVNVVNLASPDKLSPSREYYVVWAKTSNGTYNLGMLTLSKDLVGTLETECTFEPKRIIISAENDEKPTKMSRHVVLESKRI